MEEADLRWCCGSSSNDWDLHAVVRFATCSSGGGSRVVVTLPRASDESTIFFSSGVPPPPPQDEAADAAVLQQLPIGGSAVDDFWASDRSVPQPRNEEVPPQQPLAPKPRASYRNNDGAGSGGLARSKRKKKKSQVSDKEVTRVPVGASLPDPWAWRKYGQKPIKGSPYPRGYYRCCTDKDCRARKQVERCRTDPSTLIVSYSGGEHSHPVPLHRNALSGTTRNKPQPDPAAASSSPINTGTTPLLCPSVGVEYEEDDAVAVSLLLEDAEMEGEEDVLSSSLKLIPPSPTDGSGSKDDVTKRRQLPLPGTASSSRTANGTWLAAAPAAMNVTHEFNMCPF